MRSLPHPSENHIHIRIQMYGACNVPHMLPVGDGTLRCADNLSSLTALLTALADLDKLFETVDDAYKTSLRRDPIELWDEKS